MPIDYRAYAKEAAIKAGFDPAVFERQILQESGFNPLARSPAGALGIAQIMPSTARGWGVDPMNPTAALTAAAQNMAKYVKSYGGDYRKALAAYNAGPGAVAKYGGVPPYAETQNYVNKILAGQNPGSLQPPTTEGQPVDANGEDRRLQLLTAATQRRNGESFTSSIRRAMVGQLTVNNDGPPMARPSKRGVGVADDAVITAAKAQIGTPYSWGGGTPGGPSRGFGRGANTVGFDCSSLVQYAWAKAGVKLPRTTYDQIKAGKAVKNLSQAKPGDLLFPHTGHVQMYIGNGKVIESPYTGAAVRITGVGSNYIAIRRPGA